ncbi:trypsin-like peptidase domain-containing protein [Singulisphaera sp. PoT]|uniref:trypsin-like peptidase domain-containing protein n=1 Tax=Singulisphaera sp. PoT TaxID=3411797 RepID=UPI003BF4B3CB
MAMRNTNRNRAALLCSALVLCGFGAASAFAQTEAESLSTSFRTAARRVLPGVVSVRTVGGLRGFDAPPVIRPFGFGNRDFNPSEMMPKAPQSSGSGFVINASKGFILTNDHVVQDAARVVVVLHDGRERPVSQIRRDPKSDLALLIIDPKGLTQVDWGDSNALDTGDWVLAIGQPFGLSGTVTAGIVSGKGREIGMAMYEDLIQTDAAINPGNSGGPLVNLKGEVVGINTAMKSTKGGNEGIGFAIPAARAQRVMADLAESGSVRRSYIGVNIGPLDRQSEGRVDQPGAVMVTGLSENSPATEAGLRVGDILLQLDGKPIEGSNWLQSTIEITPVGQPVTLSIDRGGERLDVKVVPKAQPEFFGLPNREPFPGFRPFRDGRQILPPGMPRQPAPPDEPALESTENLRETSLRTTDVWFPQLGLRLSEPSQGLARRFKLGRTTPGLVVVGIDPEGPADKARIKIGMVVTDVDQRHVETLDGFREAVAHCPTDRDLVVRVMKDSHAEFLTISKPRQDQESQESSKKASEGPAQESTRPVEPK